MRKKGYILFFALLVFPVCDRADLWQQVSNSTSPYYIQIAKTVPAANAVDVALSQSLSVTFNDNIASSSISSATFYLNGGIVASGYNYDQDTKTIEFVPSTPLALNTTYTATITTGIVNLLGEHIEKNYSWSFTTLAVNQSEIDIFKDGRPIYISNIYDFGNILAGTSKTATFTIQNNGSDDLIIASVAMAPVGAGFVLNDTTSTPVSPGNQTQFQVDFSSSTVGTVMVNLVIDNNDMDENIFTFSVLGLVVNPAEPEIVVRQGYTDLLSPDGAYNFGSFPLFTTSFPVTFTIHNIGSADLNISSITIGDNDASMFTLDTSSTSNVVAAESSTTFTVTFTPTSLGTKKGAVIITNDDSDESTYIFRVAGRGGK